MTTHASPLRFSETQARDIYEALGELTEAEMVHLHHNHTETTRNTYLRNVYGYAAGAIARREFGKWRSAHTCSAACTPVR